MDKVINKRLEALGVASDNINVLIDQEIYIISERFPNGLKIGKISSDDNDIIICSINNIIITEIKFILHIPESNVYIRENNKYKYKCIGIIKNIDIRCTFKKFVITGFIEKVDNVKIVKLESNELLPIKFYYYKDKNRTVGFKRDCYEPIGDFIRRIINTINTSDPVIEWRVRLMRELKIIGGVYSINSEYLLDIVYWKKILDLFLIKFCEFNINPKHTTPYSSRCLYIIAYLMKLDLTSIDFLTLSYKIIMRILDGIKLLDELSGNVGCFRFYICDERHDIFRVGADDDEFKIKIFDSLSQLTEKQLYNIGGRSYEIL